MDTLLLETLWPTVRRMTRRATRVEAAIAYFSSDANIKLRLGDILVVNASDTAIRNGETSARVLARLFRRGVAIYSRPSLHAKVILADQAAIVGSGNASISSTALDEAAVATDNPIVVSQARSFIHQLAGRSLPLGADEIRGLCRIKVLRRGGRGSMRRKEKGIRASGTRTWVVSVHDLDEERYAHEQPAVDRAKSLIAKRHPKADPVSIRWSGTARIRQVAEAGDRFIVVTAKRAGQLPYRVSPPSPLLWRQEKENWSRFYYDPMLSRPLRKLEWAEFMKLCGRARLRKQITRNSVCELSQADSSELTRLWPRTHSSKK